MEDERYKLQLIIDNKELNELKGAIEMTNVLAKTLSNYSFQDKILSISNTLAEITKNINSIFFIINLTTLM